MSASEQPGHRLGTADATAPLERRPAARLRWWVFAFVVSLVVFSSTLLILGREAKAEEHGQAPSPEPATTAPEPAASAPAATNENGPPPWANNDGDKAPKPEPVAADPQPVAADPQPVAADPQPVSADPQPVAADPRTAIADRQQPVSADPSPIIAVELGATAEGLASERSTGKDQSPPAGLRLLEDYLCELLSLSLVDIHPRLGAHSATLTSPAGAGRSLPLQMPDPSPAFPAPPASSSSAASNSFRGSGHDGDHGLLAVLALSSILLGVGSRFLRFSCDIAKLSSSAHLVIERPG